MHPPPPAPQAVVMFKELDLREAGGTYFSDVAALAMRLLDVLFFDIQLCASVVHSNRWAGVGEGWVGGACWTCSFSTSIQLCASVVRAWCTATG